MTILTEPRYAGEFVISEANRHRSRGVGVIAASQALVAGALLGKVDIGALSATFVADAGNTVGAGAMSAITVAAGTPIGEYRIFLIEPAANAGKFAVESPDGVELGQGTIAVAASIGGLGFTWADATDVVVGDGGKFVVVDAAATDEGQYKKVVATATDGSQHVAALLFAPVTTAVGETKEEVIMERDMEANGDLLDYGALTTDQKVVANTELKALGIIVR